MSNDRNFQKDQNSARLSGGVYLFCALLSAYYVFSEKVPVNSGFGWDGSYYGMLVANFSEQLASHSIDGYFIRRILPPILVSLPARILGLPITPEYIVHGFVAANALNMFLSSFFWLRICRLLSMGESRTVASYVLLMMCFPVIRMLAYDPVLTDSFAFLGSIAMLYFWLAQNRTGLAITVLANLFVWPNTMVVGTLLLLFERGTVLQVKRKMWAPVSSAIRIGAPIAAAFLVFLWVFVWPWAPDNWMDPIRVQLMPLSILLMLAYVFKCADYFTVCLFEDSEANALRGVTPRVVATWLLVVGGGLLLQRYLAPKPPGVTIQSQMVFTVASSVNLPLLFLVSHFAFYSAAIAFVLLGAREMLAAARNLGVGFFATLAFTAFMSLSIEPRHILNGYPYLVLAIALSAPLEKLSVPQWVILGVIQLAGSKLWLTFDATVADYDFTYPFMKHLEYPAQWFFMNFGAWMSDGSYLLNLTWSLVMTLTIYLGFYARRTEANVQRAIQ